MSRKVTCTLAQFFFSSSAAEDALKARSLREYEQKRILYKDNACPLSWQIDKATKKDQHTKHDDPQIPQPDLRFAEAKAKQQQRPKTNQQKTGPEPEHKQSSSICSGMQWHCPPHHFQKHVKRIKHHGHRINMEAFVCMLTQDCATLYRPTS